MRKLEDILKTEKIINVSQVAKRVGLSKQALNNKLKGNGGAALTIEQSAKIKSVLLDVFTEVNKT